jgi:hypothetical protein
MSAALRQLIQGAVVSGTGSSLARLNTLFSIYLTKDALCRIEDLSSDYLQ